MPSFGDKADTLPEFHPLTVIRDWRDGDSFRLSDAQTGVAVFGATGSGKTSGPAKHLAYGYLDRDFGGLVLCAKKEERLQWEAWAAEMDRSDDLVIFDASGKWRFNFLEWEAARSGDGGGLTINVVALLDEIASALGRGGGVSATSGGSARFFDDALHFMNTNLVELPQLAGYEISLPVMRSIVNSAPLSSGQVSDEEWQKSSACYRVIEQADAATRTADKYTRATFTECRNYWLNEFPNLHHETRSILVLMLSMLVRPFVTPPLSRLFSEDTNIRPEDAFDGKIIIVDIPVQEYRLVGRLANLAWKYCFQVAVLRRMLPAGPDRYLRPVFIWADEAQNFITDFDAEYQAVARSAGGCTVYLTQNRESYRRVLGNSDSVDSLLGNLQCKIFCQNASTETNEWAATVLGERWRGVTSTNVGHSGQAQPTAGVHLQEQRRRFVESARFTTLKRGGPKHTYQVEAIVYNGGHIFSNAEPFKVLRFDQR